ncbi:WGxxGxxG-CTERM domain-containing protein [Plectonema cf. radiosum LEGE 06105]|uniref:WGxxGxxG-CTERM domain-containing protein n=1 Tax=Plectonema cf. radiosum LEGE 06105 TaxID=945769 RepID=A0A8J7F771_9CYAN|nr:WGxxGxxG family protein [Plectonema radiosum]MBE9215988.1 WGxxGxxG-CTERM domain-containing protein [Plectonema cf. radiosum LEGE 06105]
MKLTNLSKTLFSSAFAVSLATLPLSLPASAQTGNLDPDTTGTTIVREDNDSFDWGWLGLLGLLGLAGLTGRNKRNDTVAYRDPNVRGNDTTGTTTRY